MNKLQIEIDLDSITADLMKVWLELYNKAYGQQMHLSEVTDFDIHKLVIPECGDKIYDLLDEHIFATVPPILGAIEHIKKLHDDGHRIHIATAFSPDKPYTAGTKTAWVRHNLPFVNKSWITLTSQKHLLNGDVLIDDRPSTAIACREENPDKFLCTIAYPYNLKQKDLYDVYAESCFETEKAWAEIYTKITEFSK